MFSVFKKKSAALSISPSKKKKKKKHPRKMIIPVHSPPLVQTLLLPEEGGRKEGFKDSSWMGG